MFAVVLVALSPAGPDAEALELAKDLGVTPYEAGLLVRGALPVLVKRTADAAVAQAILGAARARGNEVVAFDADAVARDDKLVTVKTFAIGDEVIGVSTANGDASVAYSSILAIVRAVAFATVTTKHTETTMKVSATSAMLTGRPVRMTSKETTRETSARELVAYVYCTDGPPLYLAAAQISYAGLASPSPAVLDNFATLLQLLRGRAPTAGYDERLLHARPGADVPLLAHAIALAWTQRARAASAHPFR